MKSVLLAVFAYSALMLASVAANATLDNETFVRAIGHADFSHSMLKVTADADDDQAESTKAETMLA